MEKYVRNDELREELIKSKEIGKLTENAVEMVSKMITSLSHRYVWPWLKEMEVAEAIDQSILAEVLAFVSCGKHFTKYNPEVSENAFAYMSQVIRCSFAQSVSKFKKKIKET